MKILHKLKFWGKGKNEKMERLPKPDEKPATRKRGKK